MARTKIAKAAGRFGVRYGQSVRRRIAAIEARQRIKQVCSFCGGRAIRASKGIWNCKKCGKKFAGHAYYLEQASLIEEKSKPLKNEISSVKKEEKTKSRKKSNK